MSKPNFHVKSGPFYISPRGVGDSVFVKYDEDHYERLDSPELEAIFKELKFDIDKRGWASWEHDNWKIVDGNVEFKVTYGTATPNPETFTTTVPVEAFSELFLQVKCPYLSKDENKTVLKNCGSCVYAWNEFTCTYEMYYTKPMRELMKDSKKYTWSKAYQESGYGTIKAWLKFQVLNPKECFPTNWKRLIQALKHTMGNEKENTFVKHYRYSNGLEYKIKLFPEKYTGTIISSETGEVYDRESWDSLRFYLHHKRVNVLRVFNMLCEFTRGNIKPVELKEDNHVTT